MNLRNRKQSGGFTLIEVLVAVLIFSFGVLGFVGLQARAMQYSVGAEDTNRAALLANELATTLLLQRGPAAASSSDFAAWGDLSGGAASGVVADWQARVAAPRNAASGIEGGLPNGVGTVTVTSTATRSVARISLTWRPVNKASDATTNTYSTEVVLP
jgi:type IV pilus assembly protein PilV